MAHKKEITLRLEELLKKSSVFQQELKNLSDYILYSGVLDEKNNQPEQDVILPVTQNNLKPTPVIEPVQEIKPPVEEIKPVIEQEKIIPVQPVIESIPKKEFDYIAEKKKESAPPPKVVLSPVKPKKKTFFEKNPDLEKFIGERLITFIGIAVLFTGIAFFVKYAIDKDWINETGRSCIGILSGGILIAIAHRLRKNFRTFSSVLIGGGIAVEYFTISYSHHVYHMFPSSLVALAVLVAITVFTVLLSVLYDRQELAIIAVIGGFLTPLMVSDGSGTVTQLGAYVLMLNLGMLVLAYYKRWMPVNYISYFFTVVLFGGALVREFANNPNPPYAAALAYTTAFYLVFFLMNIVNNIKQGLKFSAGDIIVLLSNTMLYYAAGYYILNHLGEKPYHGVFTLGVAVFNFVFAFLLYKRQNIDRNLVYLLIGLVISFISLAGPVQLDGNNITLFWATETVLLLWLFQRSGIQLLAYASIIINGLMLGSLVLANWAQSNFGTYFNMSDVLAPDQPFMSNRFFITSLFSVLSLMATHFLLTRQQSAEFVNGIKMHAYKRFIGLMVLIISYFSFFMEFLTQMNMNHYTDPQKIVALATYTALFTVVFMTIIRFRKFEHMKAIALVMGMGMLVGYVLYFNTATVFVRNFAVTTGGSMGVFFMHYALSVFIIAIAVYLYMAIKQSKQYGSFIDGYLWCLAILGVFMISAEIDHLMVVSGYTNLDSIAVMRSLSGNIAYPIAWGICSFVMMVIGMRKQMRQLRIISLSLFAISILKLIWLGVNGGSEAGKIIAFISSGIVLMVVAFMYQKLKKLITEDEKPNNI
ncbi:MAG TPA: DUF2339 domain-containing protein [Flavobacteriales bacterium]|nr:DUF2339 domain-containing protein [Flavobacteriales bacterium]